MRGWGKNSKFINLTFLSDKKYFVSLTTKRLITNNVYWMLLEKITYLPQHTDEQTQGQSDGQTDGETDGQTDGLTEEHTEGQSDGQTE